MTPRAEIIGLAESLPSLKKTWDVAEKHGQPAPSKPTVPCGDRTESSDLTSFALIESALARNCCVNTKFRVLRMG